MNDVIERNEHGSGIVAPDGELTIVSSNALATIVRAEIDVQITTAKQYPRSLKRFKDMATDMATLDEQTAASCFYTVPRAGKSIQGPSVRLAEIVGSAWGNIRYGARVVGDDGKIVTAQGVCHDLERNTSATVEVSRRVTNKSGKRFTDDMVIVTCNAACSLALRNAIFRVVPLAYVKPILGAARKVAIGDAKTLASRRQELVSYFAKMGVDEKRIALAVDKSGIEDIGLDELGTLRGLATAIKDGDTTIEDAFPDTKPVTPAKPAEPVKLRNGKEKPETPAPTTDVYSQQAPPGADPASQTTPTETTEHQDASTADAGSWADLISDRGEQIASSASGADVARVLAQLDRDREQGLPVTECEKLRKAGTDRLAGFQGVKKERKTF